MLKFVNVIALELF